MIIRVKKNTQTRRQQGGRQYGEDGQRVGNPYYNMVYNPYAKRTIDKRAMMLNSTGNEIASTMKVGDYVNLAFEKNTYSFNGALLGAAIGLGFALYKRQSYVFYSIVGATLGYVATNILTKKYFKNKESLNK
jgi:hypothetical protein